MANNAALTFADGSIADVVPPTKFQANIGRAQHSLQAVAAVPAMIQAMELEIRRAADADVARAKAAASGGGSPAWHGLLSC